jgi:hypothetical protein
MSADPIAALEAALHTEAMNLPLEVLFGVLTEAKRLREDLAGEHARADMHADLGRRTAEALGIPPEEGRSHMPEVAGKMRAENEALKRPLSSERDRPDEGSSYVEGCGYVATAAVRAIEAAHIKAAQAAKERIS